MYDIIIIGGGLIGCSIGYELSKYNLNIAIIESEYDIAITAASSNSSIVYSGMENYDKINYELIKQGSQMMESVAKKFNVPYKKTGSVFLASDENEEKLLDDIYEISKQNNLFDILKFQNEEAKEYDKILKFSSSKGVHFLNTAIVKPYDLTLSYAETAFYNGGVEFKFGEAAETIKKVHEKFEIKTNKSKYTAPVIINTVKKLYFKWDVKKEEAKNAYSYYVYTKKSFNLGTNKVIFKLYTDMRIYAYKTFQGNTKICIKSILKMDTEQILGICFSLLKNFKREDVENIYTWEYYKNDLLIDTNNIDYGYIKVAGKNFASITIAPALALNIKDLIIKHLNCQLRNDYIDKRRDTYNIKTMTDDEINSLIELDPNFGKIVCSCEKVTLGEIIDSIRRPLGARTIEGIKRRTGITSGYCSGSACLQAITNILASETNKKLSEVIKESKNSFVLSGRIKEFD
ncbi:MAG: FAD-dependent oxidoreductase [Oscillospiraceae bacterium]|nr:FAD-dependent oxidoreductase [Oscillospiraceae bacterium]